MHHANLKNNTVLSRQAHMLVEEVGLWWDPDTESLWLKKTVKGKINASVLDVVCDALFEVWEINQFKDSRWVTTGTSCRSLAASCCLGLDNYITFLRKKTPANDTWLHLRKRMEKPGCKNFVFLCGLSSRVAEAALLSVMEDNRLALKVEEVDNSMEEELAYMDKVPLPVWKLTAQHLDMGALSLRSAVLQAGHIQKAFVNVRCLDRFRQPPWSLCRGDVVKNMEQLKNGPMR